jgi:hypothetical protein
LYHFIFFNNAVFHDITDVVASIHDVRDSEVQNLLILLDDSTTLGSRGYIRVAKRDDSSKWCEFAVTGAVTQDPSTDAYHIPVTPIIGSAGSSTVPFAANDPLVFSFSRTGDKGDAGSNGTNGTNGAAGATGPGVPTGGTANQILNKIDGTDFHTQWSGISDLLDAVFGNTRGMTLYRGSTSWLALGKGSADQVLTQGANDPFWASPGGSNANSFASSAIVSGRLTLTSGVSVLASDVTAATLLYWTPHRGNQVSLYDGTNWNLRFPSEISIKLTDAQTGTRGSTGNAIITGLTDTSQLIVGMKASGTGIGSNAVINSIDSGTQVTLSVNNTATGTATVTFKVPTSTLLDVFMFDNAGAPKLEFTAWSGTGTSATRAVALTSQDNVLVKTGAVTRRYMGTIVTSADGQTQVKLGSLASGGGEAYFGIWNYYNAISCGGFSGDTTDSWDYASTTWRSSNGSNGVRFSAVSGQLGNAATVTNYSSAKGDSATQGAGNIGVGYNVTNSPSGLYMFTPTALGATIIGGCVVNYTKTFVGFSFFQAIEKCTGAVTITFYGDNGGTTMQNGLTYQWEY